MAERRATSRSRKRLVQSCGCRGAVTPTQASPSPVHTKRRAIGELGPEEPAGRQHHVECSALDSVDGCRLRGRSSEEKSRCRVLRSLACYHV